MQTTTKSIVENRDCMAAMAEFPDKFFDLAVVDPPYGIGEHGQRMNRTERWKNPPPIKYKRIEWDSQPPTEQYFYYLYTKSKNLIIWGANHFIDNFPFYANSSCWLVWDKKTAGDFADCEMAWTSYKTAIRKFEYLWSGFRKEKPEPRIHPTQKPVALYDWIYKNYLPDGGKVLDTHLGSGSNRIAADKAGNIDFWGYELDKDYYEAQEKRWKDYKAQIRMF